MDFDINATLKVKTESTNRRIFLKKILVIAGWAFAGGSIAAYYLLDLKLTTLFPGCLFLKVTGLQDPGCGGTRALESLLRGDPVGSVKYNFLTLTGILIFLTTFVQYTINVFFNKNFKLLITRTVVIWTLTALVLGFWVIRNLL